jgi:hypothetical protein
MNKFGQYWVLYLLQIYISNCYNQTLKTNNDDCGWGPPVEKKDCYNRDLENSDSYCCFLNTTIDDKTENHCLQFPKNNYTNFKNWVINDTIYSVACNTEQPEKGLSGTKCGFSDPEGNKSMCFNFTTNENQCCYYERGNNSYCFWLGEDYTDKLSLNFLTFPDTNANITCQKASFFNWNFALSIFLYLILI